MDTSTFSFSDDVSEPPRTMSHTREKIEPAPWHTKLRISPLTQAEPSYAAVADASSAVGGQRPLQPPKQVMSRAKAVLRAAKVVKADEFNVFANAEAAVVGNPLPREPPGNGGIEYGGGDGSDSPSTVLIVFIPILVVILTVLLGVLMFLIALLCMKRQKGIRLTEDGGPLDLSKGDGVMGEGGTEGVESRWLETVDPDVREAFKRAKDWQLQYPPSSVPTDITLSQFLSIQEKGVSAWAFEPDYEENLSLYVQSRTEITFLSDGPGMPAREGGGNSVMANLPLPKLNEVYYWEVKLYDKPPATEVAVGLATKPYPSFRLPGWNRFSVAYFASDGFRSHNYPFTAQSYGQPLAEGDVLGVGYRPRTGTVFFTRNGRKLEDCYTGLNRLNLFPTVGANGPCTLHVNLGQAGFVFIEANVKKWGLAPAAGTLAPPPAYGSERGSILLDAGYGTPGSSNQPNLGGIGALLEAARNRASGTGTSSSAPFTRPIPVAGPSTPQRSRRHRRNHTATSVPVVPSPLRVGDRQGPAARNSGGNTPDPDGYVSPTDAPQVEARVPPVDDVEYMTDASDAETDASQSSIVSPPNPPTPNVLDISMHSLRGTQSYFAQRAANPDMLTEESAGTRSGRGSGASSGDDSTGTRSTVRVERSPSLGPPEDSPPPPGYAPLDPHVYSQGLPADLPEELINQAIAAMDAPAESEAPRTPSPPPARGLGWLIGR